MKLFLTASVAAVALLLTTGLGAQASPLPPDSVSWSYNFTPGSPAVTAVGNPSAGISFTNEPTKTAIGSSDIVGSNIRVFSTALASAPDTLGAGGAYSLVLSLSTTDASGTHTVPLTISGKLTGNFSSQSANVGNAFDPLAVSSVNLGAYTFTVSLLAYTPPGPPDQTNAGSISAHVTISAITTTGGDSPEPGTMLLAGLGFSFLGGAAWRKRRQAKVAVVS